MTAEETTQGLPQLTIDGGEVSSHQAAKRTLPLNSTQRAIIAKIRDEGSIRSVEAGVFVHTARGQRCARNGGERAGPLGPKAIGCCAYAAADGLSAMQRLEERGLVRRDSPGRWVAA